ncbi:XdhC family protein [Albidovulum sediminis]|uniref:XdhC family protein n=1 Tax=Albidovulum sediminis TaxID=3066345 RepID=A0ABT2NP35_9RHOB|nr:XdhC/CoxI family protein [Defluviimonas sediminis]MCT8330481.1 XdhC family protein [Defluviimonas sediminis]
MTDLSHDDIPEIALAWHRAGRGAALATVMETWGSAPRPTGSQLAVSGGGEMMGSVSGGCVEGAVVEEALAALADGRPRVLTFGVSDDEAFAVGLACGGRISVLVEPVGAAMPEAMLAELVAARARREPVAYVVDLDSWDRRLVAPEPSLSDRFRSDKSGVEDGSFIAIHNPPLRLAVVGAVHIAQALVPMARACGYDCLVIDPREAFGSPARFPGERLSHDWPDEALAAFGLDARTAVVTLTHDAKLDDPAIRAALGSGAFYLGCLGSTRTHAKRVARLEEAGFGAEAMARIHAPVGLDIGAKSPAEIAVSIMGEITKVLRQG